ncbi:MAG: hypothetical protein H7Y27_00850 [Gemmatimonadaceae bacterium]|nr:hypothetical protein [Chitinophagaceae bacterium]
MKGKVLVFFILIGTFVAGSPAISQQTAKERRAEMGRLIAKHFGVIENSANMQYDQLEAENEKLKETLERFRVELIRGKDSFRYKGLYLAHSTDNKLCIASWDTKLGGTMVDFTTMAIHRTASGQVKSRVIVDSTDDNVGNTLMHYDKIYSVKTGNKTLYLCHGFGQGSSSLAWQELWAYTIVKNELVNAEIFPGEKANLFIEFDTQKSKGKTVPPIQLMENGQRLSYPIADEKGGYSGKMGMLILRDGVYN